MKETSDKKGQKITLEQKTNGLQFEQRNVSHREIKNQRSSSKKQLERPSSTPVQTRNGLQREV